MSDVQTTDDGGGGVATADQDSGDGGDGGGPEVRKSRFTLPSAYTILFALIVLTALATWIVPAGTYDLDKDGAARTGEEPCFQKKRHDLGFADRLPVEADHRVPLSDPRLLRRRSRPDVRDLHAVLALRVVRNGAERGARARARIEVTAAIKDEARRQLAADVRLFQHTGLDGVMKIASGRAGRQRVDDDDGLRKRIGVDLLFRGVVCTDSRDEETRMEICGKQQRPMRSRAGHTNLAHADSCIETGRGLGLNAELA